MILNVVCTTSCSGCFVWCCLADSLSGQWRILFKLFWVCWMFADWCTASGESCEAASRWRRDNHVRTYVHLQWIFILVYPSPFVHAICVCWYGTILQRLVESHSGARGNILAGTQTFSWGPFGEKFFGIVLFKMIHSGLLYIFGWRRGPQTSWVLPHPLDGPDFTCTVLLWLYIAYFDVGLLCILTYVFYVCMFVCVLMYKSDVLSCWCNKWGHYVSSCFIEK